MCVIIWMVVAGPSEQGTGAAETEKKRNDLGLVYDNLIFCWCPTHGAIWHPRQLTTLDNISLVVDRVCSEDCEKTQC